MWSTYRSTSEALPREVEIVDVRGNRNHEVESVLVDDPFPDVEQLCLQACNTSGLRISNLHRVTNIPSPSAGIQHNTITKVNHS
jgi:hypothetical protein